MKRCTLVIVMVSMFVLLLATPGFSGQERMAGVGDNYGLFKVDGFNGPPNKKLIFVHGWNPHYIYIGGNVYFTNFINSMKAFNNGYFTDKFQVWQLVYNSGDWDTQTSAQYLIDQLTSIHTLSTDEVYIIAHSRGGLVSRQAMTMTMPGFGADFGSVVDALFTLATPHHGSIVANAPRTMDGVWGNGAAVGTLVSALYFSQALLPNRGGADLLWDNYDNNDATQWDRNLINKIGILNWTTEEVGWTSYQVDNNEANNFIKSLLNNTKDQTYRQKITAFYTYVALNTQEPVVYEQQDALDCNSTDPNIYETCIHAANAGLMVLNPIYSTVCKYPFSTYGANCPSAPPYNNTYQLYQENDGVVPTQSGYFDGANIRKRQLIPQPPNPAENGFGTHFNIMAETSYFIPQILAELENVVALRELIGRIYWYALMSYPAKSEVSPWLYASGSKKNVRAIIKEILLSEKFRSISNETLVTTLYKAVLNRNPDSGGYSYWLSVLNKGGDRASVISNFVTCTEFQGLCQKYNLDYENDIEIYVKRLYNKALGRNPDTNGFNSWVNAMVTETKNARSVGISFFTCGELKNLNLSNGEFVNRMYAALLNRDPDTAGYNHWVTILNNGNSRSDVITWFINCEEFKILCKSNSLAY